MLISTVCEVILFIYFSTFRDLKMENILLDETNENIKIVGEFR